MGTSFLMVRFVSNGISGLPDENDVLEASDTHWLEFLDERVRICDLIPEWLTLFHPHTGQLHTASITREGHGDGIPKGVDRERDIRQLLRRSRRGDPLPIVTCQFNEIDERRSLEQQ